MGGIEFNLTTQQRIVVAQIGPLCLKDGRFCRKAVFVRHYFLSTKSSLELVLYSSKENLKEVDLGTIFIVNPVKSRFGSKRQYILVNPEDSQEYKSIFSGQMDPEEIFYY